MSFLDSVKSGLGDTISGVKDELLGSDSAPPTPQTADDARTLIDHAIGRQPGDADITKTFQHFDLLNNIVTAENYPHLFPNMPFQQDTMAKLATNNLRVPNEPFMTADQYMGQWLKSDPRRQQLYLRERDPLNPNFLPYVVEANMQHHDGLLAKFKNVATDLVGRPLGGALELLSRPANNVELWYGTHFVWNDVGDSSLRHAMAKYAYEAKFSWDDSWKQDAAAQAQHIENSGLQGGAAATAFESWIKDGHQPGVPGYTADLVGKIFLDPLWLLPTHLVGEGAKSALEAKWGTEDLGKLGRLATPYGRSFAADHTIKELLQLPEMTYVDGKLRTPGFRGPLTFLTERNPFRLSDIAGNRAMDVLSGPVMNAPTAYDQLKVLGHFDEMMRTGKTTPETQRLFGDILNEPAMAEASHWVQQAGAEALGKRTPKSTLANLLEGLTKNPAYLEAPAEERGWLLQQHVLGNFRAMVRDGQMTRYPEKFMKYWLPMVQTQKKVMSVFTLSNPSFIPLNMANNLFTYMWHGMGHPMESLEMFARSFKAELTTVSREGGELPVYFQKLAKAVNVDPVAVERTIVGNVSHQDVLGEKTGFFGRKFNVADEERDAASVIATARRVVSQPLKDQNPRRFMDIVAWPVTAAGRIDRVTRRAAFYRSLRQQVYLGTMPEHLLTQGVEGAKGGLLPDLRGALVQDGVPLEHAELASNFMHNHMKDWILDGGQMGNPREVTKAYRDGLNALMGGDAKSRLSGFDLGMDFFKAQGLSEEQAFHALDSLDPVMSRLHEEVFPHAGAIPMDQLKAKVDKIANDYADLDRLQADMTKTEPVLRPGNDYSKHLGFTEEGIRADINDTLSHMQRFLDTKLPTWTGSEPLRRQVFESARAYSTERMSRLAEIRRTYIEDRAAGVADATLKDKARDLWREYFNFTQQANLNLFETVKGAVSRVDTNGLKPIESWYANLLRTTKAHREIIADALKENGPEAWQKAGSEVAALYRKSANERATFFGWDPTEFQQNMGHTRPGAALTRQVEEYLDFVKENMGRKMLTEPADGYTAALQKASGALTQEVGKRGPDLARLAVSNARMKTDFMMLNYNNQYGIDNVLQMVFPYEFFPTRTAMNWTIRTWNQPGFGAALALALLQPAQYAKDYNMPTRLAYRVPVPLPGLDNFLGNIPVIGDKVKSGDFGPVYWVDPLSILFPMTSFRHEYVDDQKRSTPLGMVADWTEKNTPLSISPFAKIIGGFTGALDRDAWTNSLFQGGPFGIPGTIYAQNAMKWLQTGDGSNVPPGEQVSYTDKGFFSLQYLQNLVGMNNARFEVYHQERALASMVAQKDVDPEAAWEALRTHSGPIWDQAKKEASSEEFLQDFTGWLGFRVTGSLRGEQIRLGEKALYEKAAQSGNLPEFLNKYPEFEIQSVADKGLSDPAAKAQLEDNHFYFRDVETLVNAPYQHALDQVQAKLDQIAHKDVILETDREQEKYLNDELQAIHEEQSKIRAAVEKAYPNRTQTPSLAQPPKERALNQIASDYYALKRGPTETPEDFAARQQRFLDQYPARTASDSPKDWDDLFQEFTARSAGFNLGINAAYSAGDANLATQLKTQRDDTLTKIHQAATDRVTRYDVEQFLASKQRPTTPQEAEFDQASQLFDIWMSYVGSSSPLSAKQKAAVSAYFRQDPLLQKHYNASLVDLRALNGDQLLALARRKDIKAQYNNLGTNAAKIDYMKAVADEYNQINGILGLPPIEIMDYRPAPPDVAFRDPYDAAGDFTSPDQSLTDYLTGSASPASYYSNRTAANQAQAVSKNLTMQNAVRYVNPQVQRGY
jgi:hypothetical protein